MSIEPWKTPSEITTLGHWGGEDLPRSFVRVLQEKVATAREAMRGDGPDYTRHIAALEVLREYAQTVDATDPVWWLIWLNSMVQGNPTEFVAGEKQGQLLSWLGGSGSPPLAEVTLRELAAAGVTDALNVLQQRVVDAERREESAQAESAALRRQVGELESTKAQLVQAQDEIDTKNAELGTANKQLAYLREHYIAGGKMEPDAASGEVVSEWATVKGHKGIVFKRNAAGVEKFKISYYDTEKKQRWKTFTALDEAVAARQELLATPPTPEAVAA